MTLKGSHIRSVATAVSILSLLLFSYTVCYKKT